MIKQINLIILLQIVLIAFTFSPVLSLEKLSRSEMKNVVAQSGIDIALSQVIVFNAAESLRFINPDENRTDGNGVLEPTSYYSYLEFGNTRSLIVTNSGTSDVDGDGDYGFITIDVETINENPYFALIADDMVMNNNTTIGQINYCGNNIGSMNIVDSEMTKFHLYMGAHDSGIDAEIGFSTRTELFEFKYNDAPTSPDTGTLAVTGAAMAGSFTGSEDDPSTWESVGEFVIGDIKNDKPIAIDIMPGGASDPNPGPHISLQIGSVQGSCRVENINFGGNDLGQVIIDGINLSRLDVELPGRGLGRP